jgi:hypothetical protein
LADAAALTAGDDHVADLVAPANADPVLVSTQRQLLIDEVSEHRAKIAALSRQQAQKETEYVTTAAHYSQAGSHDPGDPAARRHDALRER